ncbi:ATP-grasp domain-containing protein [Georgenia wutianyii]|uniref:ATP-grasp domain-containing protein n=1 Tax=Georgenia wutianyii TaxID=2585135 RepID=A0ABX5VQ27_9MICO|nr:ATP-grasp domain-containing protein [Georgenia wutianyii]QDB79926.1 ATP-grasp domain-containing protein [Georgenia wutianyii]
MRDIKIVIGSAGRRTYLVGWFMAALAELGLPGEVIVTENDVTSPSFGLAHRSVWMPPYADPAYAEQMLELFTAERPDLFVPLNDFEIDLLSRGLGSRLEEYCDHVLVPSRQAQRNLSDKLAMSQSLAAAGVTTPRTWLAAELDELRGSVDDPVSEYVVKHRFGSGSSGLRFATPSQLDSAVAGSLAELPAPDNDPVPDLPPAARVVVQQRVPGDEYGVDGVFSLTSPTPALTGVLARRKLRMRAGETDKAVTVDPAPFVETVTRLGDLIGPRGLVDIDIIRTADGAQHVIDINPRFGGGYPFCHAAGANVPLYILQSLRGAADPALLEYRTALTVAKYQDVRVVGELDNVEKGS